MPKAILEFNLPEERDELMHAWNGTKNSIIIEETWNKVFRPYHKHGYADQKLNKLLESKDGQYIIEKLTEIYQEVLNDNC